ncbi:MAG: type transport system permease protein [Actinomycetota bacterium]|jgi:ABC-2 type transport system permease protein
MNVSQIALLSRRSLLGTLRQPGSWIPPIVFPMIFAALNSAAFARSTQLPGFPKVDSFLDFMLATTIVQGVLFGSTIGGTNMAIDIQDGFFDRLVVSPVPRSAILIGRLAGGAALAGLQAVAFIGIFTVFGASVKGGLPAIVALVLIAMVLGIALGGFPLTLALRTGSSEAVQAAFPLLFIFLFVSSAFFPRQLMHGWYQTVAGVNPLSWLVESLRHQVIADFSIADAAEALAIAAAIGVLSLSLASAALRSRLAAGA